MTHRFKHQNDPQIQIRPVVVPIGPSIAYVELTQGKWSLIDSADVYLVNQYNWHAKRSGDIFYARRVSASGDVHTLHGTLLGAHADHRNGDGLDNRLSCNLRPANRSQNNCNRRRQSNNSSGYKGVSWHRGRQRWEAIIQKAGKRTDLGGFATPRAAYDAYCSAAAELHGEFARVA